MNIKTIVRDNISTQLFNNHIAVAVNAAIDHYNNELKTTEDKRKAADNTIRWIDYNYTHKFTTYMLYVTVDEFKTRIDYGKLLSNR